MADRIKRQEQRLGEHDKHVNNLEAHLQQQEKETAILRVWVETYLETLTIRYGYKLRLCICLNGVDSEVGRNIALFVQMVKGDYDDLLRWPFTGKITLTILDQSEGFAFRQHISKTLIARPNLLAFQKPIAWCNSVYEGHKKMAPIEHISNPQYIKNDTMLVCVDIES
ncbi:TNF receptor-associated factor 4-like [Acropora muricata]|uniref:TNF receptor-associated factor 4-like n=1 Tax=Acropora muricata TaxID=159855 RepID=UPI0034E43C73